jgi:hypothetical protein
LTLEGKNATTLAFETGRSARIDDYGDSSGPFADGAREHGVRSSVATPTVVEASRWGVMVVGGSEEVGRLPVAEMSNMVRRAWTCPSIACRPVSRQPPTLSSARR